MGHGPAIVAAPAGDPAANTKKIGRKWGQGENGVNSIFLRTENNLGNGGNKMGSTLFFSKNNLGNS